MRSAGDRINGGLHECRGIKACEGLCWWVVFTSTPLCSVVGAPKHRQGRLLHVPCPAWICIETLFLVVLLVIAHEGVQDIDGLT